MSQKPLHVFAIPQFWKFSRNTYIVTEYASCGDLYTRILNGGKIPEDEAKHIFAQITAAVDHMVKNEGFDLKFFKQ